MVGVSVQHGVARQLDALLLEDPVHLPPVREPRAMKREHPEGKDGR